MQQIEQKWNAEDYGSDEPVTHHRLRKHGTIIIYTKQNIVNFRALVFTLGQSNKVHLTFKWNYDQFRFFYN
jgi:hypothetical protein